MCLGLLFFVHNCKLYQNLMFSSFGGSSHHRQKSKQMKDSIYCVDGFIFELLAITIVKPLYVFRILRFL